MKKVRRLIGAMLACCMMLTMSVSAAGGNVDVSKTAAFDMELTPATQTRAIALDNGNNLQLSVKMDSSEFVHDTQIPLELQVQLDSKGWNTSLQGEALVYNQNNQTVLFGSATGYNGERTDENFLSINFTYDVETGAAIANVTYDILDVNNKHLEFGQNTDLFADAYRYLEDKMTNAHDKQVATETIVQQENEQESLLYSLDTSLTQLFVSGPSTCSMTMYAPRNLASSGSGPVSATMKGNVTQAEKNITTEIGKEAWATVASNCDVSFYTVSGLRFMQGEQHPTSAEKNVEINIPIPGTDLTYPFKWNVWRINASTTADALASRWNTYNVQGIDVESERGPGFYTYINQSGNKYGKLQVKGSSKIGYHYLYIDGTGRENNATWYSRTEGSGYINVVSV